MIDNAQHRLAPSASIAVLRKRAALLRGLREFLWERGFFEVETPLLAGENIPELHIEPFRVGGGGYLQASPELFMKRLLAGGAERIFQVTRSFRAGERGRLHNPEFTIVEWYRVGDDMAAGVELLDEMMQTLLGSRPAIRTTYAAAFQRCVGICPHSSTIVELAAAAGPCADRLSSSNRDEWLNLLLATRVEPQLGRGRPEIIYHYPASQASLARIARSQDGHNVAERFELYWHGVELANGFHELTDAAELRQRLDAVNAARAADGRHALPLPESLLAAMERGLPKCAGCSLGFDRLAMLAMNASSIDEVMAFTV
jgi:lysyl-tRNA synthetase class 2